MVNYAWENVIVGTIESSCFLNFLWKAQKSIIVIYWVPRHASIFAIDLFISHISTGQVINDFP